MAPKTKQARHCAEISRNRKQQKVEPAPNPKMDPKLMVVSGLLTDNGYVGMKRNAQLTNTPTCSKRTYYLCQKKVVNEVVEEVREDCKKYASQIKDGSCISIDGRWNHTRNGSNATVSFIDESQKKVLAIESTNKVKGIYGGNFIGSSRNMETAGIEKGLATHHPFIKDKEIFITHDHDNTTSQLLKNHTELNLQESLDPGHAKQEIKRKANSFFEDVAREMKNKNDKKRNTIKKCFEIFATLITHIICWFNFLVKNVRNPDKKEKMWLNVTDHVLGNHDNCEHPHELIEPKKRGRPKKYDEHKDGFWVWEEGKSDENLKNSLDTFLSKNKDLVRKTGTFRTQMNESLNSMISRTTPKNKVFNTSNDARAAIAAGRMNNPHFDTNLIQKLCPNTISPTIINEMKKYESNNYQNSLNRNSLNERNRKNQSRQKLRESFKNDEGD